MRAKKPGYDSEAVQGELVERVCSFFGRVFDDYEAERHAALRGHRSGDEKWLDIMNDDPTISETAKEFGVSPMDSTSHPFINDLAENKGDMHTAIEHKLDVMELERQGKKRSDIMDLFADFPDLPGVKEAMQKVYGWNDETYIQVSAGLPS